MLLKEIGEGGNLKEAGRRGQIELRENMDTREEAADEGWKGKKKKKSKENVRT